MIMSLRGEHEDIDDFLGAAARQTALNAARIKIAESLAKPIEGPDRRICRRRRSSAEWSGVLCLSRASSYSAGRGRPVTTAIRPHSSHRGTFHVRVGVSPNARTRCAHRQVAESCPRRTALVPWNACQTARCRVVQPAFLRQ